MLQEERTADSEARGTGKCAERLECLFTPCGWITGDVREERDGRAGSVDRAGGKERVKYLNSEISDVMERR